MAIEGQRIGRYLLYEPIASGGMASVHFGRMVGPGGFARTVVVKRLHAHLVRDVDFAAMFLDEGHLAARIQHPNVVATIDVASLDDELLLVMEYVRGESLSRILGGFRAHDQRIPLPMLSSVILGVLYGLEAAHEAKTEQGVPLGIVHRDVSPQNVIVGADGLARVADFGVAKAASRSHSTRDGKIKGKLAYMAPEQLRRLEVDRRADIYAVGVILWEAIAGRKLFSADDGLAVMHAVLNEPVLPLTEVAPGTPDALSNIVAKALSREPQHRYGSALEMAEAIETASPPALQRHVGAWVLDIARGPIAQRDAVLAAIEASSPSEARAKPSLRDSLVRLSEQPTDTGIPVAEGGSIVTGLSVSAGAGSARGQSRPRSRRVRGVLLGVALLGVVGAGLSLLRTGAAPARADFSSTPAAPSSADPVASPSAPLAASSPSSFPAASAPASSQGAPPPSSPARPTTLPLPPSTPRSPPRPARGHDTKPSRACDPPFTVGPDGIERFKPGCL